MAWGLKGRWMVWKRHRHIDQRLNPRTQSELENGKADLLCTTVVVVKIWIVWNGNAYNEFTHKCCVWAKPVSLLLGVWSWWKMWRVDHESKDGPRRVEMVLSSIWTNVAANWRSGAWVIEELQRNVRVWWTVLEELRRIVEYLDKQWSQVTTNDDRLFGLLKDCCRLWNVEKDLGWWKALVIAWERGQKVTPLSVDRWRYSFCRSMWKDFSDSKTGEEIGVTGSRAKQGWRCGMLFLLRRVVSCLNLLKLVEDEMQQDLFEPLKNLNRWEWMKERKGNQDELDVRIVQPFGLPNLKIPNYWDCGRVSRIMRNSWQVLLK